MSKNYLKKSLQVIFFYVFTVFFSSCDKLIVLQSKGQIGQKEAELIYLAFGLMLIVVVPVFIMVVFFAYRYRASNTKANYAPKWSDSKKIEWIIWMVPVAIIAILSYLTWTKTKELDPYKTIKPELEQLRVEVVSLDWNWLFIYPDDSIATINELVVEAGKPISFRLTSATVMTSFFIPQLGSQMYAMAGMETKLNLIADHEGIYEGKNIEYSGEGYNSMHFKVIAKNHDEFNEWVKSAKKSKDKLSIEKYKEISKPNIAHPITVYSSVVPNLFNDIMAPYMEWMSCGMNKKQKNSEKVQPCCEEETSQCCHEKDSLNNE